MDLIAAWQDGRDLERVGEPTPFCRAVAQTGGAVLLPLVRRERDDAAGWSRQQWAEHIDQCVYCRRMRRTSYAQEQRRAAGLPEDEPLLRDWLLAPQYRGALERVTERFSAPFDIYEEGPTITARLSPAEFLAQMVPVARRLLLDVLKTAEPAERFLAYLGRPEVMARPRRAEHVRDEIGPVLATFCQEEGLASPGQVPGRVTRRRLDDLLWRVAVKKLKGAAQEPEREALGAIERNLADESVASLAAIDHGLAEVLGDQVERALRSRSDLVHDPRQPVQRPAQQLREGRRPAVGDTETRRRPQGDCG